MSSALDALAATSPRDLLRKGPDGQRALVGLTDRLTAEGLLSRRMADDIERLHALFDVACECGLATYIYDYVVDVCLDKYLTSSDPVEAFLLDGHVVRKWCERGLGDLRASITSSPSLFALASGASPAAGAAGGLPAMAARVSAMVEALAPLQQQQAGGPIGGAARPDAVMSEALLMQQLCQAVAWALPQQQVASGRPAGRYASLQEWKIAVNRRRDAAAAAAAAAASSAAGGASSGAGGGGTFLDALLAELRTQHGVEQLEYPPPGPEAAIKALFSRGSGPGQAARKAKLALLAYYAEDAGWGVDAGAFSRATHVPEHDVGRWRAGLMLDEAAAAAASPSSDGSASAEAAAQLLLSTSSSQSLPFRYVEALHAYGQQHAALTLLSARSSCVERPYDSLPQAAAAQRILLAGGQLTQAFLEGRRYYSQLPSGSRARSDAVRSLVESAAAWASRPDAHRLHQLAALPLDGWEEEALVGWLRGRAADGQVAAAAQLVLYYLQRGRLPEAMQAHAELAHGATAALAHGATAAAGAGAGASGGGAQWAAVEQLLGAASRLMPPAQLQVEVVAGLGGGDQAAAAAGAVVPSVVVSADATDSAAMAVDGGSGGAGLRLNSGLRPSASGVASGPHLVVTGGPGGGVVPLVSAVLPPMRHEAAAGSSQASRTLMAFASHDAGQAMAMGPPPPAAAAAAAAGGAAPGAVPAAPSALFASRAPASGGGGGVGVGGASGLPAAPSWPSAWWPWNGQPSLGGMPATQLFPPAAPSAAAAQVQQQPSRVVLASVGSDGQAQQQQAGSAWGAPQQPSGWSDMFAPPRQHHARKPGSSKRARLAATRAGAWI